MFKKWVGGAKKHGGLLNAASKQVNQWGQSIDNAVVVVQTDIPEKQQDALKALANSTSRRQEAEKRNAKEAKEEEWQQQEEDFRAREEKFQVERAAFDVRKKIDLEQRKDALEAQEEQLKAEVVKEASVVVPTVLEDDVSKVASGDCKESESMIQTDIPLNLAMLTYIAINKLDIPPAVTTAIANATSSTEVVEALVPLGDPALNAQMLHWTMHNSGSDHTPEELKSVVFAHLAEHSDHHKALSGLLSETDIDALAHGLVEHGCGELAGDVIDFFLA